MTAEERLTNETVELLQALIRNACVNDGRPESGHEVRSSDVLEAYLDGVGLGVERFEPTPGRRSLLARIEGSDPTAPTLLLMGHTDVVPAPPSRWRRDPFGGELVDGEVWGRGAIDMLNLTSSMAVAVRHLAASGWRPRGTLLYLGVADEEAGGNHGAHWLVEHELDAVRADYVITESGGWTVNSPAGPRLVVTVGEKGAAWRRLRVRGTPAHASMPFGTDNALVTAAEVVRRIAMYRPAAIINDVWRSYAAALDLDAETKEALVDPARVWDACAAIPDQGTAKFAHACTHTTFSPDVVRGGTKTNVVPDEVEIDVDVRILPGQTGDDVDAMFAELLGPLAERVVVEPVHDRPSTQSPTDTPLWHALERLVARVRPDATLLPRLTAGGTDATFFRDVGSVGYGFGVLSRGVTFDDFAARFHGIDERIDVESLGLTTQCWLDLSTDFLG
jgi:acetylornithine deacetylase/succinyl-diaminopimelate desuccinylase-like protein